MNEDGHKVKRLQAKQLNELFEEDLEPPEDQNMTTDEEHVDGEDASTDEDPATFGILADVADDMDTAASAAYDTTDDLNSVGGDGAGDA